MVTMEKLVIATGNPGKKERYGKLLAGVVGEVLGLSDFAFKTKPAETGATAEENARIKALFYLKKTKLPVFAEDESLFVDFLSADNQPGACV